MNSNNDIQTEKRDKGKDKVTGNKRPREESSPLSSDTGGEASGLVSEDDDDSERQLYGYVPDSGYAPFSATPYTLNVSPEVLERKLRTNREYQFMDVSNLPDFPWLCQDREECFENLKVLGAFKNTLGSINDKQSAMVAYINRFWCQIVNEERPCLLKKVWRDGDWSLVERTNKEFEEELIDIRIYLRDDEADDDGNEKPAKPNNPAKLWLKHKERRRFSRRDFNPTAYYTAIEAVRGENRPPPSFAVGRRDNHPKPLNTFTGMALDPYLATEFVEESSKSAPSVYLDDDYVESHLGLLRAEFIDYSCDLHDINTFGLGSVVTRYPNGEKVIGPPHPSNPEWEEHLEQLLFMVQTVPLAKVYVDGKVDAPREQQVKLLLRHFGRTGDPWGDCGFSLAPWLEFVFVVISRRNWEVFEYVISWCSSILKCLGQPRSVSMDLYHRQNGGGKSMFCSVMCSILGSKWVWTTSDPNDILGDFTSALEDKLMVVFDEVKLQRSHGGKQNNVLKNLLTGGQVLIHHKYKSKKSEKKWCSFMMTSNDDGFVIAQQGERRHCLLEIETKACGQMHYLSSLYNLMHGNGRCYPVRGPKKVDDFAIGLGVIYWCDYLMKWPLDNWSEWPVPDTRLLKDCQVGGMSVIARWWYGKLQSGQLLPPEPIAEQWPIESANTIALRRQLTFGAAFRDIAPTPPHISIRTEYDELLNKKETMARYVTAAEDDRLALLSDILEQHSGWNQVWPRNLLYLLCQQDCQAIRSYIIPSESEFVKEMALLVGERHKGNLHVRYRVKKKSLGQEVARDSGRPNYHGLTVPGFANNPTTVMPEPADYTRTRILYAVLPSLKEAKELFAASQQWGRFEEDFLQQDSPLGTPAYREPWSDFEPLQSLLHNTDAMKEINQNTSEWLATDSAKRQRADFGVSRMFGSSSEEEEEEECVSTPEGGFAF